MLWTRRRAKTLHRQWRLIEDASVLPLPFINRPSVFQRRAGVVKRTGSIEFRDSPGVSSLALLFFPPSRIARWFCDSISHARSFCSFELFSSEQQGRSRSTRSISGNPSDGGQVLLDYVSSLRRNGHWRDTCIERKSAISPTSRGNRFSLQKSVYLSCYITTRVAITFFSGSLFRDYWNYLMCIRLHYGEKLRVRFVPCDLLRKLLQFAWL